MCSGENIFIATGGKANFQYLNGPAAYSSDTYVISGTDRIETKYLYYFLLMKINDIDEQLFRGAALRHLSRPDFKQFLVPLLSLPAQRRIVDLMTAVDSYILALQQQAAEARNARNAVLHALLTAGRGTWNELTPNIKRFEDMAHLKRGHDLPIQSRKDGEYEVIASNGIVGHHNTNIGPIPGVVTGRSGTIGKVFYIESGYWPLNTTLYTTDFMGNVERFVALTLEVMRLEKFAGGTTVPSLDRKVFREELVYVPAVSEQTRIVEIVSGIDEVIRSTEQAVADAQTLRSGLLSELLSGAHEIPESYDRLLGVA
jgi:type I restriction enzyme S subunit